MSKPVTAITFGAGSRGNVYGDFAITHPEQLRIIGVADRNTSNRLRYQEKHQLPDSSCYSNWEEVLAQPKLADAIIITTGDKAHYEPCVRAMELGYDVLLEKPIGLNVDECRNLKSVVTSTGRIVAVCHVLRYAPYFVKMKQLVDEGAIGQIISIQHLEPIQYQHMAHSYVRGNWHQAVSGSPIILAKSSHDLDIISWMIGNDVDRLSAFGSLNWFKKENAPESSTERCLDGCAVEGECPYSARKIYLEDRSYNYVFDLPEGRAEQDAVIHERLATTNYGRCVYRMDNDQPDHYVVNMEFEGGATATFSMEAFTAEHGRKTRLMGSHGELEGDMNILRYHNFRTGEMTTFDMSNVEDAEEGYAHGGGDWRLMEEWVTAVKRQDKSILTSPLEEAIESHLMAFAAEKSRRTRQVIEMKHFK